MRPSFNLVLHRERNGRYSVRLRLRIAGAVSDIGTGVVVPDRGCWDARRRRVRQTSNAAAVCNVTLAAVEGAASSVITRAAIDGRQPTREEVTVAVLEAAGRSSHSDGGTPSGWFEVWDIFTDTAGRTNSWTPRTRQKFASLRRHLSGYAPHLRLDTLTAADLQGFTEYLCGLGLRNSTVGKLAEHVRWFLRWAADNGYYHGTLHRTYRPKLKGAKSEQGAVVYLTIPELERLESFDLTANPALAAVRDVFVFCCYSGLRFSDAKTLKETDIHDGSIHVVTRKTDDPLSIELNSHTRAVLERWRGRLGGLALPAISNAKTNGRLKELGRVVGLDAPVHLVYYKGARRFDETRPKWEVLTTHAARRTFVVTALTLGVPAEVIIRWTGHSDFSAMKPYIAIVDEVKRAQMAAFDSIAPPAPPPAPPIMQDNRHSDGGGCVTFPAETKIEESL